MIITKLKVEKVDYNGKYTDIILRSDTDNVRLYLSGNEVENFLTDKEYTLTLDDRTKSKDARGYAFGLINQIANLLQTSKDEVYELCLKRYSQVELLTIPIEDYKPTDYKHHEFLAQIDDKVVIKIFKGISEMNAHELNIFFEGVKSECAEMGISTETPSERSLLNE